MRQRRFLPSISLLSAFDAVLRTGSTSGAGRELNLSQSSVSRLIQTLERQLGKPLFERRRQKLVPAEGALAYGRDIANALDIIQRASMQFAAEAGTHSLSLAILPAFGARWLAPRLGDFLARHPDINITLAPRLKRFDFALGTVDAAIHFGADDWPEARHMKLFDERLVACVSPDLMARQPIRKPRDLAGLQLLQLETRRHAWERWFEANGLAAPPATGIRFDHFSTMTEAAIGGLGAALLPDYFAAPEIEEGRLVRVPARPGMSSGAYWLVWPPSRENHRPLRLFRSWLEERIADYNRASAD